MLRQNTRRAMNNEIFNIYFTEGISVRKGIKGGGKDFLRSVCNVMVMKEIHITIYQGGKEVLLLAIKS